MRMNDMHGRRMRTRALLPGVAAMAILAGGCEEATTEPNPFEDGVPEEELTFLSFPSDAILPPATDTSFWAVAGEDRELVLRYAPEEGEEEGEEFLELEVGGSALWKRPDGSVVQAGDSVQIHVSLDPERRFLFRFGPSGLQFNPDSPAELEITYLRLNGDVDDDGDVDEDDDDFEERMRLWRQEAPGERWFPVGTIRFKDTDEIRGEIDHFTGFAIAV